MLRALPASVVFLSLLVSPALAKPAPAAPAPPPLLPTDFAGWSHERTRSGKLRA